MYLADVEDGVAGSVHRVCVFVAVDRVWLTDADVGRVGLAAERFDGQRLAAHLATKRRPALGVDVQLDPMPVTLRDAEPMNQVT